MESTIVKELNDLQTVGLKLHFVFEGLDHGINDDPFGPSMASAANNAAGFETYDKDLPYQAIQAFRTSGENDRHAIHTEKSPLIFPGTPTSAALSNFLKKTLHKHGIPFTVAPYSALAQVIRLLMP